MVCTAASARSNRSISPPVQSISPPVRRAPSRLPSSGPAHVAPTPFSLLAPVSPLPHAGPQDRLVAAARAVRGAAGVFARAHPGDGAAVVLGQFLFGLPHPRLVAQVVSPSVRVGRMVPRGAQQR